MDYEDSLRPQLKKVKDVFGCTVALRYSDLISLKQSNIRVVGEKWYLQVKSKKTSTFTSICLPEYAIDILMKYSLQKAHHFDGAFYLS